MFLVVDVEENTYGVFNDENSLVESLSKYVEKVAEKEGVSVSNVVEYLNIFEMPSYDKMVDVISECKSVRLECKSTVNIKLVRPKGKKKEK